MSLQHLKRFVICKGQCFCLFDTQKLSVFLNSFETLVAVYSYSFGDVLKTSQENVHRVMPLGRPPYVNFGGCSSTLLGPECVDLKHECKMHFHDNFSFSSPNAYSFSFREIS